MKGDGKTYGKGEGGRELWDCSRLTLWQKIALRVELFKLMRMLSKLIWKEKMNGEVTTAVALSQIAVYRGANQQVQVIPLGQKRLEGYS